MKVILTEKQAEKLIGMMMNETKEYSYSPENVLIVKKYLDDNFRRGNLEGLGEDGLPSNTPIVVMINIQTGKPVQDMYDHQLLELLIDKFQNMFVDEIERKSFLLQVMKDWYDNKIGLYGGLSVNHV